jgi:hypothetical protein
MNETNEGAQVQEAAPEIKVVGKKSTKSGDVFFDVASEVESLTRQKALSLAETLAENIETNYFKLGGVLKRIYEQSWFEGFESFDEYVYEKFGFKKRKADYLMKIYTGLIDKQIPWSIVAPLGWTKLKDLVDVLTPENVEEWVAKAEKLTVVQLQAALKANAPEGEAGSAKTTSDSVKLKFDLKTDQAETVQQALNKAKADTGTEFDSVALENVMAGYLSGQIATKVDTQSAAQALRELGWEEALKLYAAVFPGVDLSVDNVNGDGTVEAPQEAAA